MTRKFLLFSMVLLSTSCQIGPDFSSDYGLFKLKISDSQIIFFKREVRGLSYDSLVISTNSDYCQQPDLQTEYSFKDFGPHTFYYKVDNRSLIIYCTSSASAPVKPFPLKVEQHELLPLEYDSFVKQAETNGFKLFELQTDKRYRCN